MSSKTGVRSQFQILSNLFLNRFTENDSTSPGGSFQTSVNQVIGILLTVGLLFSYVALIQFVHLSAGTSTPEIEWLLRILRLSFPAYSFGIAGFIAVFYWDKLFPDRRDFLILAPFPIRLREMAAAKFLALISFLFLMLITINAVPDLIVALMVVAPGFHGVGIRLAAAQFAATWGASLFAFVSVIAFEGVLLSVTSVKTFKRISPWIQMLGMSLAVLSLLGFPFYAALFPPAVKDHALWLYLFPPVWFSGFYELFLGGSNQLLASLTGLAIQAMVLAILALGITWGFGFRRHFRRTLESEDAPRRMRGWSAPRWLIRTPQETAVFGFIAKTLGRSQQHQFFMAAYLSAGLAIAVFFGAAIKNGKLALSIDGARAVGFVIGFFVISGFRAAFQFPAELGANWIFRMSESRWSELSRSVTRKLVLVLGVAPAVAIVLPVELSAWRWPVVLLHCAVQLADGALLFEVLFWDFDKVPFTCSYYPGRKSLALLVVLYFYGITGYSFHMADIEHSLEHKGSSGMAACVVGLVALLVAWRRRVRTEAFRFDGREPEIQTLELT